MLKKFLKDAKGVVAIEFGFILPIIVIVAAQTLQFGWSIYVNHALLDAVRSTTRSVSVGEIEMADASATISSRLMVNISGVTVQTTSTEDPDTVTITASVPKANVSISDILGMFQSGQLTSSSTMRLE